MTKTTGLPIVAEGPVPAGDSPGGPDWLVASLLADQQDLTAVERFAQFHEGATGPLQGRYYEALMPASPPGPRQQYAFEVDLDRCSGCKACVSACHVLNGLDEGEVWRDVGLLVGGPAALPVLQHVTSACHHCLDPACLNACPTEAYEKDPVTGIVRHLDDQCFGCQYCTLACPYDVPKYHAGLGIVRKCDLCAGRLSAGEAPACVQACPHEAIRVRVVDRADTLAAAEAGVFLPTAHEPGYTKPTTRYLSARRLSPGDPALAADHHKLRVEHAHAPLVVMLVLTQAAVGAFLVDSALRVAGLPAPWALPAGGFVVGQVGLAAALLHLGRPQYFYRAVLGFRHSWLSREVLAFSLFAAASAAASHAAALAALPDLSALAGVPTAVTDVFVRRPWVLTALSLGASLSGLSGIYCSVMVYAVVRRPFWRGPVAGPKFVGTAAVAGLAGAVAASPTPGTALALAAAVLAKLGFEAAVLVRLRDGELTPLRKTALLLIGPLAGASAARVGLGLLGGAVLPLAAVGAGPPGLRTALGVGALLAVVAGEVAERYLFFAAVVRSKMPGGLL